MDAHIKAGGKFAKVCPQCKGEGILSAYTEEYGHFYEPCPKCKATGFLP